MTDSKNVTLMDWISDFWQRKKKNWKFWFLVVLILYALVLSIIVF